jgi:type I restriction enzyme S subunit
MYGIVLPGPNVPDGVPIVKGGDVSPERLRLDRLNRTTLEIESGYVRSRLRGGDLVYAIRGSIGEVAIVPDELDGANLTQDAARIAYTAATDGRWLLNALKCAAVFGQLKAGALGATIRGINIRDLKRAVIPVPPEVEQRRIAAFLDHETARIDALVAKKERLIELLREKRISTITRAVTKGLAPDVPMKDSGVGWLGAIPVHWEVKKWRYCCHVTEGQVPPDDDQYRDRIMIAPNHVESGTGRILFTQTADEQGAISGKYLVRPGDLIYSKIRPALNKACIAGGDWLCSADMYPVKVTESDLHARYLLYFVLSDPFVRMAVDESMRVAMPKVNRESLAACPVPIPPPSEQDSITMFLDGEAARIDALVAEVHDAIDRLEEFRSALISAAVTGKIDVREVGHGASELDATEGRESAPA